MKVKTAKIGLSRCNFLPVEVCEHLGKARNKPKRYYYVEGFLTSEGIKYKFFGFLERSQLKGWTPRTKEYKESIQARKDRIKELKESLLNGELPQFEYDLEMIGAEKSLARYYKITKLTKKVEVYTWHDVIVRKIFGSVIDQEKATKMLKEKKWKELVKLIHPEVKNPDGNDSKYEERL